MIKVYCDECGEEIKATAYKFEISELKFSNIYDMQAYQPTTVDTYIRAPKILCKDCINRFLERGSRNAE